MASHRRIKYALISSCLGMMLMGGCKEPNPIEADKKENAILNALNPNKDRFSLFESGQVRPLALSPSGDLLFAVNTPANRLEIFKVNPSGLSYRGSVPVGLEPIAVAARSDDEVWVVNHLSDSISIVSIDGNRGRVVRTLLVGDEPRDIVFAGPQKRRAFITTAHRGQNSPIDPQLTTPGVGRADVWVFDANNLGSGLGGNPLKIISLFSDTPRALAVTPDGTRVYAAAFHSGNRTTTIFIPNLNDPNAPVPGPNVNAFGEAQPAVSLIVKYNGSHWVDENGTAWDSFVRFSLPDKDVFVIDAMANPPNQLSGAAGSFSGVGTILNNMIVNPASGKVYVTNLESLNEQRFEGPGNFAGHSVRGQFSKNRITILDPGAAHSVTPRHLNKHINYSQPCCNALPNSESIRSLALPQGMAITSNGQTLYVAAQGSSKIGIFNTAELETDTFTPSASNQIEVSGGGPAGVVLDKTGSRLYVLTRFDNSISVINTTNRSEIAHLAMRNPEPPSVKNGRRFLYDAALTSARGDSACASCHIDGDNDALAWDLGNPDARSTPVPGPFINGTSVVPPIAPTMKGPMSTQSLRGMANHGPMHWRGDRTGGVDANGNVVPSSQPDTGTFNERAAFGAFQLGFTNLLGRQVPLSTAQMEAFTDFILQLSYPPNPIRALDNSLTPDQQAGHDFFFGPIAFNHQRCVGCHVLDRNGNAGQTEFPGFFGTQGFYSFDNAAQLFKVPHLRNAYQKVGMFGFPKALPYFDDTFMGDQIRGFGYIFDGSFDTVFRFLSVFSFDGTPGTDQADSFEPQTLPDPVAVARGNQRRRQVEAFVHAFDTNMFPVVGQQITFDGSNDNITGPRVTLLEQRADQQECDLIVKADTGREYGLLYLGNGFFIDDRGLLLSDAVLRFLARQGNGLPLTFTCVPPGNGRRLGIDRDGDGILDGLDPND